MQRHTFKRLRGDSAGTTYALYREGEGREAHIAGCVQLPDADGNHEDNMRMICFLFDALAVRDADALDPADWVEIGSDDEDEDLYAEAYDAGYADALADFLASDEDDVVELHHASSYDEGFRDGSAAAFELAAEGDEVLAEDDEDELTDDDYSFRNC